MRIKLSELKKIIREEALKEQKGDPFPEESEAEGTVDPFPKETERDLAGNEDDEALAEWMDNKIAELQSAYYEEIANKDIKESDEHFANLVRQSLEHNLGIT